MAGESAPQYGSGGQYYTPEGELRPLDAMMPPGLGGILNALDMNPNKAVFNGLMGDPYAYQQARFGGRSPSRQDIMVWEQQQRLFTFDREESKRYRERVVTAGWRSAGFSGDKLDAKAQNSMSVYNPVGLAAQLTMMATVGESGADKALQYGFRAMNIYAPDVNIAESDPEFKRIKKPLDAFTNQFKKDFYDNMNAYGGLNMQGAGQVFQQMSRRSIIGEGDITNKAQATSKRVQEMSQAVGAMQELFGGSIPEIFDKMDRIFGGNAGAMGGQQLQSRVLRLKQASLITGQSLDATAEMMVSAGTYAERAGMDAGIGSAAAEQTMLSLGVNYADGGFGTRRINAGRLRSMQNRANVAATTSRQSQSYSGAYLVWLRNQRDSNGNPLEANDTNSAKFFELAKNAGSVSELAQLAGGSVTDVQTMSMSDQAKELMADDRNIARYSVQARAGQVSQASALAIQHAVRRATGKNVALDAFLDDKGNLRGSAKIIETLQGAGVTNAAGIVGNQLEGAARRFLGQGATGQELQAYLYQTRNADDIRKVQERRAQAEALIGRQVGGPLGILNYLAEGETFKDAAGNVVGRQATLGGVLKAAFGVDQAVGNKMSAGFRKAYRTAVNAGDKVKAAKIQTILSSATSGGLYKLSEEDREDLMQKFEDGTLTDDDINTAYTKLGTSKQQRAEEVLKGAGAAGEAYKAAINKGTKLSSRQTLGRRAAVEGALGTLSKDTADAVREALGGKELGSISEARERLKDVDFGGVEGREKFFKEVAQNAEALDSGDPVFKLNDVLFQLVDVLNGLRNDRNGVTTDKDAKVK